ncbi:MAG: class B sortase [Bacillota bacterium]|nr:class B sortase [Bacillota bacterium]
MKKKILFRFFLIIFIVSIGLLINTYYKSYKADKLYSEARDMYYKNIEEVLDEKINNNQVEPEPSEETENSEEGTKEVVENPPEESEEENYEEDPIQQEPQQEVNQISQEDVAFEENVIGWLNVDGTKIDYPVVQADDNDYYLNHNYKGERDSYGSIYMDFRNVSIARDDNIIIYGHKIRDGSMFSDLAMYTNEGTYKEYFKNNDTITLDYNGERTTWEIYSAYVVNLNSEDYHLYTIFKDRENYKEFIQKSKDRSLVKKNIDITENDTVISLVTCNFWYDNARVILHGKLIE